MRAKRIYQNNVANTDLGRKLSWITRACKPLVLNR